MPDDSCGRHAGGRQAGSAAESSWEGLIVQPLCGDGVRRREASKPWLQTDSEPPASANRYKRAAITATSISTEQRESTQSAIRR